MTRPRSAAALLITLSLAVVIGCGGGSSPDAPAGMAAVLQGSPRTISPPGAAWTVRRERLPSLRGQHLLQFLANTPGRRLAYEQRELPSGYAFRMLSETFGQPLSGNDHTYAQPAVAGGRWAVTTLERVRRMPRSGRPGYRLYVVLGDVASGRALRRIPSRQRRGSRAVAWCCRLVATSR